MLGNNNNDNNTQNRPSLGIMNEELQARNKSDRKSNVSNIIIDDDEQLSD